jgi:hypothetical protein
MQIWVNSGEPWNVKCWYILWTFGLGILRPFGIFVVIWYMYFFRFGMLYIEKSGSPDFYHCTTL